MSGNTTSKQSTSRETGRVKYFNSKSGFGFITVTDGPNAGKEYFAHHSEIVVEVEQYRYLVQGEYVEFEVSASTSETHEEQASNITGVKGGKLMCETRRDTRLARTQYREQHGEHSEHDDRSEKRPESRRKSSEWTHVGNQSKQTQPKQSQPKQTQPKQSQPKQTKQKSTKKQ
jgi:cold shock CspA family protein